MVLIWFSLMTNDIYYLFLCLLVISISLKKCPFISLPILIGLVDFLLLSCKSFYTFCIHILYQSHSLHIYPSDFWVLFAISSWCPLQHKSACYYYFLFHVLIVTGQIILVKCNFTAGRGSGLGMAIAILKWQWFLGELPLFFPDHTMWLVQMCLLLSWFQLCLGA